MTHVPEVTLTDYKDWAQRHDMKMNISDDELEDALSRANRIAQKHEDDREANRAKHTLSNSTGLKPSNKGELESSPSQGSLVGKDKTEVISSDAGSSPAPGSIKKDSLG